MLRFTVRRMTIGVATVAVSLVGLIGVVRLALDLKYATLQYGWNTSIFPIGQPVMILENFSFEGVPLAGGTPGIVTGDPPDEDSAYPDRLVGVKIADGPHRGTTQGIRRRFLRAR